MVMLTNVDETLDDARVRIQDEITLAVNSFDLDREAVTRHLTFSAGPRVCLGATLSRVEQRTAWGVLLDRLDSIEYGAGNDWLHQPGIMLGTLKLNLDFRKATMPLSLGTGRTTSRD